MPCSFTCFLPGLLSLLFVVPGALNAQERFSSGAANTSARTGTQGVVGNPDCAPPVEVINGQRITPINWSCDSSSYWARRAPPPAPPNPCEPNYDMSTPAGRAAAQAGAAQTKQNCLAARCVHNPSLQGCEELKAQALPLDPDPLPPFRISAKQDAAPTAAVRAAPMHLSARVNGPGNHPDVSIPVDDRAPPKTPDPGTITPPLPPGAVGRGDPRAAKEVGGPGIIGSFPGTANDEFCATYCAHKSRDQSLPIIAVPQSDPDAMQNGKRILDNTGHYNPNALKPGDRLVFFKPVGGGLWSPVHYAVYQGDGIIDFKNGTSDVYVGKLPEYLNNWVGAKVRAFPDNPGAK